MNNLNEVNYYENEFVLCGDLGITPDEEIVMRIDEIKDSEKCWDDICCHLFELCDDLEGVPEEEWMEEKAEEFRQQNIEIEYLWMEKQKEEIQDKKCVLYKKL